MKIKELYTDESKWTKGAFSRDIDGNEKIFSDDSIVSWCLLGAIDKCYTSGEYMKIWKLLFNTVGHISNYNDSHTFKEIKQLVEELDI